MIFLTLYKPANPKSILETRTERPIHINIISNFHNFYILYKLYCKCKRTRKNKTNLFLFLFHFFVLNERLRLYEHFIMMNKWTIEYNYKIKKVLGSASFHNAQLSIELPVYRIRFVRLLLLHFKQCCLQNQTTFT